MKNLFPKLIKVSTSMFVLSICLVSPKAMPAEGGRPSWDIPDSKVPRVIDQSGRVPKGDAGNIGKIENGAVFLNKDASEIKVIPSTAYGGLYTYDRDKQKFTLFTSVYRRNKELEMKDLIKNVLNTFELGENATYQIETHPFSSETLHSLRINLPQELYIILHFIEGNPNVE